MNLRRMAAALLVPVAAGIAVAALPSPASAATVPQTIVQIATEELGDDEHNHEVPAGSNCNYYSDALGEGKAICGNGWRSEEWCADFATWVWKNAGVRQTDDLSPAAVSFKNYGKKHGTWHTSGPKVGDAASFRTNDSDDSNNHVGLVVAVNDSARTVTVISGNSGDRVRRETFPFSHGELDGYVTPLYTAAPAPPAPSADSATSAVVQYNSQLVVFGRSAGGEVWQRAYTPGGTWSEWRSLAGNCSTDPVAVQYGTQLEVACLSAAKQVIHDTYTPGGTWSGWRTLPGTLSSLSMAVYNDQLVLAGVGKGGEVFHQNYTPGVGWSGWYHLHGVLRGTLSVVQYKTELEVVGRAPDGSVWHTTYTPGAGWSRWYTLGGDIDSNPTAVVYNDQLSIVGVGGAAHNAFIRTYTPGSGWAATWGNLGGGFTGNVDAVQYGGQLALTGRTTADTNVVKSYTPGSGWGGWGELASDPRIVFANDPAIAVYNSQLVVVGRAANGQTRHDIYTPGQSWSGWYNLEGNLLP